MIQPPIRLSRRYFSLRPFNNFFSNFGPKKVWIFQWVSTPCQSDLAPLAQAAYTLGITIGALSLGPAADSFGRKPVLLGSLVGMIGFGALGAYLAPTFVIFAGLRFLVGIGSAGITMCSFVLLSEIVGPSVRGFCGTLCQVGNNYCKIWVIVCVVQRKIIIFS